MTRSDWFADDAFGEQDSGVALLEPGPSIATPVADGGDDDDLDADERYFEGDDDFDDDDDYEDTFDEFADDDEFEGDEKSDDDGGDDEEL